MNRYCKNAVKIGVFGLILLVLIALLGIFYSPKIWFPKNRIQDRTSRFASIELEEPESLDVITIGDSLSDMDFTPMELWRNYGYTGYNAGCQGQSIDETYFMLKKVLQTQTPKVVLLEGEVVFRGSTGERIQSSLAQQIYYYLPALRFHNLWKRHFDPEGVRIYHHGYCVNGTVGEYTGPADYLAEDLPDYKTLNAAPFVEEYLSLIKELCDEKGVELVMYTVPSPKNYNQRRVDKVAELAANIGASFIDLNAKVDEIGLDWSTDSSDGGDHLNVKGAAKVTIYLGEYLTQNYEFIDRREDKNFLAWNEELESYDQLVEEMDGRYFGDIEAERYGINWDKILY